MYLNKKEVGLTKEGEIIQTVEQALSQELTNYLIDKSSINEKIQEVLPSTAYVEFEIVKNNKKEIERYKYKKYALGTTDGDMNALVQGFKRTIDCLIDELKEDSLLLLVRKYPTVCKSPDGRYFATMRVAIVPSADRNQILAGIKDCIKNC